LTLFTRTVSGLMLAWVLGAVPAARADIYRLVDAQGVVHLSDRPLGRGSVRIVRTVTGYVPASRAKNYLVNRRRYAPLIDQVAHRMRLDRALVHAVVYVESGYDPRAVSRRGAVGLMQLMPATARRYGVRDRYDPGQNVYGGVRYLRDLLYQFRNVVLALAAYNAGENAVLRARNRVPPFTETRRYVRKVLSRYRQLRRGS